MSFPPCIFQSLVSPSCETLCRIHFYAKVPPFGSKTFNSLRKQKVLHLQFDLIQGCHPGHRLSISSIYPFSAFYHCLTSWSQDGCHHTSLLFSPSKGRRNKEKCLFSPTAPPFVREESLFRGPQLVSISLARTGSRDLFTTSCWLKANRIALTDAD